MTARAFGNGLAGPGRVAVTSRFSSVVALAARRSKFALILDVLLQVF